MQPHERIIALQAEVKNLAVSGSCQLLYLFRCETAFFLLCDIGQEFFFSSLPFFSLLEPLVSLPRHTFIVPFFSYFSAFFFIKRLCFAMFESLTLPQPSLTVAIYSLVYIQHKLMILIVRNILILIESFMCLRTGSN